MITTTKFLGFFHLRTGVILNGFALIFDLLGQMFFMYNAGKFDWFEHNYPLFDFTKTILNIFTFLLMLFKENNLNRKLYYLMTLLNTIATGVYSPYVWKLLWDDPTQDRNKLLAFLIIFAIGFPYQIYSTFIVKKYYESEQELKMKKV